MKKAKKTFLVLSFLLLLVSMATTANAAVKISKKAATLIAGQSTQLKITGTRAKVTWGSGNKTIATVSKNGKVTAKKKGVSTITAKVGKKKYNCKVTVQAPTISKSSTSLASGKTETIKLNGTNQKISWESSNKNVATVTSKGVITAKKAGTVNITATVLGRKYSCKVTVTSQSNSLFKNKEDCGGGSFFIYTPSETSENGNIPTIYVDKNRRIGSFQYCVNGVDSSVPVRIYIDGEQVDMKYTGRNNVIQAVVGWGYPDKMVSGLHTVEMVQYKSNNPKDKIITYRQAKYRVIYW